MHADPALALLRIDDFSLRRGGATVLDHVTLALQPGRTLGLVGESGAGKSTLALAIMGLLAPPEVQLKGSMQFGGEELVALPEKRYRTLRGNRIGLIFQDAAAALDPCFTIGEQLQEPLRRHLGLDRKQSAARAAELLTSVGIADAALRLRSYPHQLSGGMQQRVMIAIALACNPELLIADEPTSALDVTIQAQIMELILAQARALGSSAILVMHDLALASQVCNDVAVMYAGQIVEMGPAAEVLGHPVHPYTAGLRACVVELGANDLAPLPGSVPAFSEMKGGCRFAGRCPLVQPRCIEERPPLEVRHGRQVACWYAP